jgi:NADPH-dependent glutamate synthase beta subunit-like oxidoreductase
MPADRSEIEEAQAEGVEIYYLAMPVGVVKRSGKIKGLKCIETRLGEADESGRRRPIPVTGSEFIIETDSIIAAVGQRPDISWNLEKLPFEFSPMNTFRISDNYLTNIEGVFAAGDALTGPTTVVEAMASGRNTATAVNDYLVVKGQKKK